LYIVILLNVISYKKEAPVGKIRNIIYIIVYRVAESRKSDIKQSDETLISCVCLKNLRI